MRHSATLRRPAGGTAVRTLSSARSNAATPPREYRSWSSTLRVSHTPGKRDTPARATRSALSSCPDSINSSARLPQNSGALGFRRTAAPASAAARTSSRRERSWAPRFVSA